jgi:hypothetical protein
LFDHGEGLGISLRLGGELGLEFLGDEEFLRRRDLDLQAIGKGCRRDDLAFLDDAPDRLRGCEKIKRACATLMDTIAQVVVSQGVRGGHPTHLVFR